MDDRIISAVTAGSHNQVLAVTLITKLNLRPLDDLSITMLCLASFDTLQSKFKEKRSFGHRSLSKLTEDQAEAPMSALGQVIGKVTEKFFGDKATEEIASFREAFYFHRSPDLSKRSQTMKVQIRNAKLYELLERWKVEYGFKYDSEGILDKKN